MSTSDSPSTPGDPGSTSDAPSLTNRLLDSVTDALRYWEYLRILFNVALAAIVLGHMAVLWPGSWEVMSVDMVLFMIVLAVIANIFYCAAYPVDIFVQVSGLRAVWRRRRWVLFAIGLVVSGIFTHWIMIGMLTHPL